MNDEMSLLLPILAPIAAGVLVLLTRRKGLTELLSLLGAAAALAGAVWVQGRQIAPFVLPWGGEALPWLQFSLRLYPFSAFMVLLASAFATAVVIYSFAFVRKERFPNQFYAYMLFSVGAVNGALLADHLVTMLFFWEGMLGAMFGIIAVGRPGAWKTATKALIILGICDLCMMFGIILVGIQGGTFSMSALAAAEHPLTTAGWGGLAFVLLMIGATSKAGAMPFHTWIPDAAVDAPLPFMAILPASLEKMLGIYFLARVTMDLFKLTLSPESWASYLLMILGAVTIVLAVMMALVQKDYKRLLSYHAISQAGYMILGIGTATPIGIVGGLFHLINNALYKSGLFLTGGAVERQTGTTDLSKLGGLAKNMPITFGCFFVAAISISGFPFTNGFYSKELVYDGALERHWMFYAAALLGSVFTAASFLKLGHAAYCGKRDEAHANVKEAPFTMLLPMIAIAGACLLFGLGNALPLQNWIQPVLGEGAHGHDFSGVWPHSGFLVGMTVLALAVAFASHFYGVRKTGKGLGGADHIHYAPVLSGIYERAERRGFDPYDLARSPMRVIALIGWVLDRLVDWFTSGFAVLVARILSFFIRVAHTGNYATYVAWSLAGAVAVLWFLVMAG
jgi:formate hydrogenlyase subunit 3/multisubunit Na+/H+ antiporter MnhD subunit